MSKSHLTFNNIGTLVARKAETKVGKAMLSTAVSFLTGLLASRAEILNGCAPFGVAAVAAAAPSDGPFVLLGAILGYALPAGPAYPAKYIAAAAAAFMIRWLLSGFKDIIEHPALSPVVASGTIFVTGMAIVITNGVLAYDIILCISETLLCGCCTIFMQKAMPYLKNPSKMWGLTQHDLISMTISYCILLIALSRVQAGGISMGRIVGIFSILIAARYGREAGGSITGIAVGIVMSLADKNLSHIPAGYGLGGLISGVFAPTGRFGCAAAFILSNAVAGIYLGNPSQMITGLYEVTISTILFMLLPEGFLCRFSALFVPAQEDSGTEHIKETVSVRLSSAAGALDEISKMVSEVMNKLAKLKTEDVSTVFADASQTACKRCGMKMFCWETAYNDTMGVMNDMTDKLKRSHKIERDDVPRHFAARCCKLGDFINDVNKSYAEYTAKKSAELHATQLRSVLSDEFEAVSDLLTDLSNEFNSITRVENTLGERVRAAFASCGLDVADSSCHIDGKGRLSIEADIENTGRTRVSKNELLEELGIACGKRLEGPMISNEGELLKVRFTQKPDYSVRLGEAFLPKNGEKICGDAYECFLDGEGRALMILSDGMGCGGRAAVDSNLAAGLMSRLLHAGFGFDSAMGIVNSSLMLKSGEESFATLDIASIDLYTGEAEFLKAGAAPTYIRRCGRAERISQSSVPAGILKGVRFARSFSKMRRGDLVVIISDGVVTNDDSWLVKEIEEYHNQSLNEFARTIAIKAKEMRTDGHDDDITVLAASIR